MKVKPILGSLALLFAHALVATSPLDLIKINPIIAHVNVLQELKARFLPANTGASKTRAIEVPTVAHIKAVEKGAIVDHWAHAGGYAAQIKQHKKEYKKMIDQIIDREYQYGNQYYAFYHGQSRSFRVLQDFLKEIYALEKIAAPLKDFEFLRVRHKAEKALNQLSFIDKEEGASLGFHTWNDHRSDLIKNMICVNLALFGSMSNPGEYTFSYFKNSTSLDGLHVLESVIKDLFTDFGFDHAYIAELKAMHSLITTTEGNLFQIFIPKDKVDQYVYLSHSFGTPYRPVIVGSVFDPKRNRHTKISSVIDAYLKNPAVITDFDKLQARVLMSQDGILNPESGVKIFRYIAASDEAIQKYQQVVKEFASKVFSDSLRNRTLKNIKDTRLEKLLSFIGHR